LQAKFSYNRRNIYLNDEDDEDEIIDADEFGIKPPNCLTFFHTWYPN
jgi:hypothetical protein